MIQQDYSILQGNSWNPGAVITENGAAKDCTDFDCKLMVKEINSRSAPEVLDKEITWTVQASGTGSFSITPAETLALKIQGYFYEIILYKEGYEKTIKKGKLLIEPAVGQ